MNLRQPLIGVVVDINLKRKSVPHFKIKFMRPFIISVLLGVCAFFCESTFHLHKPVALPQAYTLPGDTLPEPYATKSAKNFSKVLGWKSTQKPVAPQGFIVSRFADSLKSPRWIYVAPNGDILVAEVNHSAGLIGKIVDAVTGKSKSGHDDESANRITLFRDVNEDGKYDLRTTFLSGVELPLGMVIVGDKFYVACSKAVWQYPYKTGQTEITGQGKKIIDLPEGGRHWTRNIIANAEGTKLYISVGSGSDHAEDGIENEKDRALIIEINPDGTGKRVYASGIRNPVGMGWAPGTNTLWTAVNERDELGDNLVPDYLTSVKDGGFYGWPFSYYGQHVDPRIKEKDQRPDLVKIAVVPDVSIGDHTASLGLAFYTGKKFPAKYHDGAFVGQRGSWNRSQLNGYKVVFVPFKNGKPTGPMQDFLTGFIANNQKSEVYGRPVGVAMLHDGSLLVADDAGDVVWRVSAK
ncbi:MAG: L-sorbosone dehydrogenase [Bacteroidota bacterium]|nr:L-sorbosone dehydrogenase [Bacteroidota bacterium]